MPDIAPGILQQAGIVGTLVLVILGMVTLIFRKMIGGGVVAQSTVDRIVREVELRAEIAERREENWRQAYIAEVSRGNELLRQNGELLEVGRVTDAVMRALPTAPRKDGQE